MAEPSDQPPTPLLRRWQGCLPAAPEVLHRLEQLTGAVLMLLLAGLPFVSRSGLALEILACGLLWLLWSLRLLLLPACLDQNCIIVLRIFMINWLHIGIININWFLIITNSINLFLISLIHIIWLNSWINGIF